MAFGAVLLALIGSPIIDPDNFDFRRFGSALLNVAMFSGLFLLFGTVIAPLYARIDAASRYDRPSISQRIVGILVWLAATAALIFVGFVVVANAVQIVLGRHPPELIAASLLGAVALAVLTMAVATDRPFLTRSIYGILGLAVIIGAIRTLLGIAQILTG